MVVTGGLNGSPAICLPDNFATFAIARNPISIKSNIYAVFDILGIGCSRLFV